MSQLEAGTNPIPALETVEVQDVLQWSLDRVSHSVCLPVRVGCGQHFELLMKISCLRS
jgi:hypothetical protein